VDAVDAVVVGAGAAGLMCALEAGKRGRRVVVLEHNPRIARKILISGGGRCNFTNRHTTPENFVSRNPHFAKSALARFTPSDFVAMVERHQIPYHEKTLGQLFCDRSAGEIVAMLEAECASAGVRIETACTVARIAGIPGGQATGGPEPTGGFALETSRGVFHSAALVVATGGLSILKMGATPFGYALARQFALAIVECRPALVPLTFGRVDRERFADMAGVSADVTVRAAGPSGPTGPSSPPFREKLLFTHRGLSGPAVLQASSYWCAGDSLEIDLLPDVDFAAPLAACRSAGARTEVRTVLANYLPKRLADRWCQVNDVPKAALALSDREIAAIAVRLHAWRVQPAGTEGYEKAEVTRGGVDTGELSSRTMECRRVPGLYFIGEVVDVTGQLGGFNFQWAWASGAAAGRAL
jgi:predicted Rossmann fold flavoprotein